MQSFSFTVLSEDLSIRLDAYIASKIKEISRSAVQGMIDSDLVYVNGIIKPKSYKLSVGDIIDVTLPPLREVELQPQDIPLNIVYEDDSLIVVNKPKGMVVHPAAGNWDGTLVNALLFHCDGKLAGINGEIRPGIVHRIDKDTSGLLVVAKSNSAHISLSEQMSRHSITRIYNAVVYGKFKDDEGFVDRPIGRSAKDRKKMSVNGTASRSAYTHYKITERYTAFTQLALKLQTGRTHQIRVHMASIGHPVAGDAVYGPKTVITSLNGQCLHARTLGFIHPDTDEYMEFSSELPPYFIDFISKLQRE